VGNEFEMATLTFIQLAEKVLTEVKSPLSIDEIWDYASDKNYIVDLNSSGKTPKATLSARVGQARDIFSYTGNRPRRYYLLNLTNNIDFEQVEIKTVTIKKEKNYLEKDLHPLLVYFAKFYLNVYCKTINHSKSNKKEFGEWLHPDIVGCCFPIDSWQPSTLELSQALGVMNIRLYSFELKRELNFTNLRESFFQAVSNSSWAHEGYLCAAEISENDDFLSEIKRLSNSFGIGLIHLDTTDPDSSRIIYPAKSKDTLDWESMNKLCINTDFQEFLKRIKNDLTINEIHKAQYDKVLPTEELIDKFKH
jgi:hypothetical protein